MNKKCIACNIFKPIESFYLKSDYRRHQCKDCYNEIRRYLYKESICRKCKKSYKPNKKGFGRYCSEKCRFIDKIKIDKNTGCWIWQAHKQAKSGYGTFLMYGWKKSGLAHRASFIIFNKRKIGKGMFICHHCDNPTCVNPDHLWEGNNQDNQLDCEKKMRRLHPSKQELLKKLKN